MQIDERPRETQQEEGTRPPLLSVPVAFAVLVTGTLVVLAGLFLVGRALRSPEAAPAPTVISATMVPTAQATAAPTPQPTVAPTAAPPATSAPAAAPVSAVTVAPTAVLAAGGQATTSAAATAVPTVPPPGPTPPPALAEEVLAAYQRFWQVKTDALLNLDGSNLDEVAIDSALTGIRGEIEQDRAVGRAVLTDVQHNSVPYWVQGDDAAVVDIFRDSSIYVDPTTHEPLPGEVHPTTPAEAPEFKQVYRLRRVDGTWKVWGAQPIS